MLDHLKKKPPAKLPPLVEVAAVAPPEPVPPPEEKPKKAKPPEKPSIVRSCGHKQGLKDLETTACAGCQAKRQRERKAAKKAAWQAKATTADPKKDEWRFPAWTQGTCTWDGERWVVNVLAPAGVSLAVESTSIEYAWRLAKAKYLELTAAATPPEATQP